MQVNWITLSIACLKSMRMKMGWIWESPARFSSLCCFCSSNCGKNEKLKKPGPPSGALVISAESGRVNACNWRVGTKRWWSLAAGEKDNKVLRMRHSCPYCWRWSGWSPTIEIIALGNDVRETRKHSN